MRQFLSKDTRGSQIIPNDQDKMLVFWKKQKQSHKADIRKRGNTRVTYMPTLFLSYEWIVQLLFRIHACTNVDSAIDHLRPSCFLNAFNDFAIIGATPAIRGKYNESLWLVMFHISVVLAEKIKSMKCK